MARRASLGEYLGEYLDQVHIKLVGQPLIKQLDILTVWVDQGGFESGSNYKMAKQVASTYTSLV